LDWAQPMLKINHKGYIHLIETLPFQKLRHWNNNT